MGQQVTRRRVSPERVSFSMSSSVGDLWVEADVLPGTRDTRIEPGDPCHVTIESVMLWDEDLEAEVTFSRAEVKLAFSKQVREAIEERAGEEFASLDNHYADAEAAYYHNN